jgi:hypothetical protein
VEGVDGPYATGNYKETLRFTNPETKVGNDFRGAKKAFSSSPSDRTAQALVEATAAVEDRYRDSNPGPQSATDAATEAIVATLIGELSDALVLAGVGVLDAPPVRPPTLPGTKQRSAHWWLHVDLDVLSTDALPAVDYPQRGGLTWAQLHELTAAAVGKGGCVGASVVIYNPDLDKGANAELIVGYLENLVSAH